MMIPDHDLDIGESECARIAEDVDAVLREVGHTLGSEQLDHVVRGIMRTWLSGYRFGVATVIAQASDLGIHLFLVEDGDPYPGWPEPGGI